MSKTNFIKDTIEIDDKINVDLGEVQGEMLEAVILPYYMDPDSSELTVVLQRTLMPGQYARVNRKMGISALTVKLPEDKPITIEDAYASLNLPAAIQNAIPFGSVMPAPYTSNLAYELVIVHTEPFEMIDKERGIILQKKGEYEIGAIKFGDIIEGIQNNVIQDLKTRLILNELYILALEESSNEQDPNQMMTGNPDLIGGGSNLPAGYAEQEDTMVTSDIPDDVIAQNSQMDYGAMYSKASSSGDFKTIDNKN